MRQLEKMTRPPLFGKGATESRAARQARRARVKAGDTISKAEAIEPIEFTREEVVETPAETPAEKTEDGAPSKRGTGGGGRGRISRALSSGGGTGDGVDILPTSEKIAMDIEAAGGGVAAPMSNPDLVPRPTIFDETVRGDGTVKTAKPVASTAKPVASRAAPAQSDPPREKSAEAGRAVAKEVASAAIPVVPAVPGFGPLSLPLAAAGTGARASAIDAAGDVGEAAGGRLRDVGRAIDSSVPVIGEEPLTIKSPEGEALARIPSVRDIGDTVSGFAADVVKGAIDYAPVPATARRALTDATASVGKAAGEKLVDAFKYLGGIEVEVGESESRDEEEPEDERDEEEGDESARRVAKR